MRLPTYRLIYLTILFCLTSCVKIDCQQNAKNVRDLECIQIVQKLPFFETPEFNSEGIDLNTGEKCKCRDGTRTLTNYIKFIDIGDTIIKKKNELTIYIHKKDTILAFKWECGGKIYE